MSASIERRLETIQEGVTAVREDVAALKVTAGRSEQLGTTLAEHEKSDAETHGSLRADVKRIWWLVGIALAAAGGALADTFASIARASGG